jgi:hypothetical protein
MLTRAQRLRIQKVLEDVAAELFDQPVRGLWVHENGFWNRESTAPIAVIACHLPFASPAISSKSPTNPKLDNGLEGGALIG